MLLNFQRFGKMKGMGTIVEWSIRDETLHVQGNAKLFREFCEEHPRIVNDELKSKIYQMARNVSSVKTTEISSGRDLKSIIIVPTDALSAVT